MGCASGTFRSDDSRNMDNQRELSSHKQSRVESCLSCSETVCYCCNVQNRTACYRQHDCSVLHSKTRGDTFPTIVSGDLEASQLVSVNVNSTPSQTCARETQCFSRRVVPSEQDFTCGMDTETRDSSNPISVVRNSDGRSVCNQTKSSSTTVCVANTRPSSLGSRCAISKLEPTVRVRFSTVQSDSGSTRTNSTVTPVQNYSNNALLASESWYNQLLSYLVDSPIRLPLQEDLLSQSRGHRLHMNPGMLHLHAWMLSNDQSERTIFLKKLPLVLHNLGEPLHVTFTTQSGEFSHIGVSQNRLIHSVPL